MKRFGTSMANAKKPVGAFLGLTSFGLRQFHQFARWLAELAMQTDKGVVLATALVQELRREKVVLPPLNVIERICALAITRANRKICLTFAETLNDGHRVLLEGLFRQPTGSTSSTLAWLRQTPGAPSAKHLLEHLQRLKTIEALDLPEGLQLQILQNRWLKLATDALVRAALNAAENAAQMAGERDQHKRSERQGEVNPSRRLFRSSVLSNAPPAEHPNHSARRHCEDQMQEKIALESRAFQLPLPGSQPARDGHRSRARRREQIVVCNGCQCGIFPPDREEIKRQTRDEQCNRKMNDHGMLGVLRKQSGFKVKRVHTVIAN